MPIQLTASQQAIIDEYQPPSTSGNNIQLNIYNSPPPNIGFDLNLSKPQSAINPTQFYNMSLESTSESCSEGEITMVEVSYPEEDIIPLHYRMTLLSQGKRFDEIMINHVAFEDDNMEDNVNHVLDNLYGQSGFIIKFISAALILEDKVEPTHELMEAERRALVGLFSDLTNPDFPLGTYTLAGERLSYVVPRFVMELLHVHSLEDVTYLARMEAIMKATWMKILPSDDVMYRELMEEAITHVEPFGEDGYLRFQRVADDHTEMTNEEIASYSIKGFRGNTSFLRHIVPTGAISKFIYKLCNTVFGIFYQIKSHMSFEAYQLEIRGSLSSIRACTLIFSLDFTQLPTKELANGEAKFLKSKSGSGGKGTPLLRSTDDDAANFRNQQIKAVVAAANAVAEAEKSGHPRPLSTDAMTRTSPRMPGWDVQTSMPQSHSGTRSKNRGLPFLKKPSAVKTKKNDTSIVDGLPKSGVSEVPWMGEAEEMVRDRHKKPLAATPNIIVLYHSELNLYLSDLSQQVQSKVVGELAQRCSSLFEAEIFVTGVKFGLSLDILGHVKKMEATATRTATLSEKLCEDLKEGAASLKLASDGMRTTTEQLEALRVSQQIEIEHMARLAKTGGNTLRPHQLSSVITIPKTLRHITPLPTGALSRDLNVEDLGVDKTDILYTDKANFLELMNIKFPESQKCMIRIANFLNSPCMTSRMIRNVEESILTLPPSRRISWFRKCGTFYKREELPTLMKKWTSCDK